MTKLDDLYQDYWQFTSDKVANGYTVLEFAAVSLSCALSIYKTTLNQDDFDKMIDFIGESRDNVKKILLEDNLH